jgi:hypothetical protein
MISEYRVFAMGGIGSGRWGGRPIVENCQTVDASHLWRGSIGKGVSHSISRIDRNGVTGCVILYFVLPDGTRQQQDVELTSTPQRLGGRRFWFVCPLSGRRVATLHLPPGATTFASRQAHRLGYRSQRIGPLDTAHARLARLYAKLGAEYHGWLGPPPARPSGMHRETYRWLLERIEDAKLTLLAGCSLQGLKALRRFGLVMRGQSPNR